MRTLMDGLNVELSAGGIGIDSQAGVPFFNFIDDGPEEVAGDGEVVVGLGAHAHEDGLVFGA